jgi:hypothetical protein
MSHDLHRAATILARAELWSTCCLVPQPMWAMAGECGTGAQERTTSTQTNHLQSFTLCHEMQCLPGQLHAKTSKQPPHTKTNPVRVQCIRLHERPHNMRTCERAHARTAHPAQGQAPHLVLGETTSSRAKPFRCIAIQVLLTTMGVGVRVSHETVTVKRALAGA